MSDPVIKVPPGELSDTSPQFLSKATSVTDLATGLNTASTSLINTLGLLTALQMLEQAMENYRTRLATSMECFSTALKDTGHGLFETANLFVSTDSELAGTFATLDAQSYPGFDSQTPSSGLSDLQGLLNGDTPASGSTGLQGLLPGGTLTDPGLSSLLQQGSVLSPSGKLQLPTFALPAN